MVFGPAPAKLLTPRLPIVFAHGVLPPFLDVGKRGNLIAPLLGDRFGLNYWRGILPALESSGIEVHVARQPRPTSTILERAEALKKQLQEWHTGKRFNIVGHSMGGLDGRCLVSKLGGDELVSSLTTVATPHRGSSIADWSLGMIGDRGVNFAERMLQKRDVPICAFRQLTVEHMEEFCASTPDSPDVRYFSFAAARPPSEMAITLLVPQRIILNREGENDGLVSVKSAMWGEFRGTIEADHLEQINWGSLFPSPKLFMRQHFDAVGFYRGVFHMLHEEGL